MPPSPLSRAAAGGVEKLSDNQTRKALGEAMGKLDRLSGKASAMKAHAGTAVTHAVTAGEVVATTFVASTIEGAIKDKSKLKYLRATRLVGGAVMMGWGLLDCLNGAKSAGSHQVAVANGLLASEAASLGIMAGSGLREKYDHQQGESLESRSQPVSAAPPVAPPPPTGKVTVVPGAAEIEGALREVHAEGAQRDLEALHGSPSRFRPAA